MNLILEVLIQTVIALAVYGIAHWAFLQYNDDFPQLSITQGVIIGFLIFSFSSLLMGVENCLSY